MKRASVGIVVLLFVTSVISLGGSSAGRTLKPNEAAALWGRGQRCYNNDDNCEANDDCADHGMEPACELAKWQIEIPGPKYKCLYWPWSVCTLATPRVCVIATQCKWYPETQSCLNDPNCIPWDDKLTHRVCANSELEEE